SDGFQELPGPRHCERPPRHATARTVSALAVGVAGWPRLRGWVWGPGEGGGDGGPNPVAFGQAAASGQGQGADQDGVAGRRGGPGGPGPWRTGLGGHRAGGRPGRWRVRGRTLRPAPPTAP